MKSFQKVFVLSFATLTVASSYMSVYQVKSRSLASEEQTQEVTQNLSPEEVVMSMPVAIANKDSSETLSPEEVVMSMPVSIANQEASDTTEEVTSEESKQEEAQDEQEEATVVSEDAEEEKDDNKGKDAHQKRLNRLEEKICRQQSILERLEEKLEKLLEGPQKVVIQMPQVPMTTNFNLAGNSVQSGDDLLALLRSSYESSSYFSMSNNNPYQNMFASPYAMMMPYMGNPYMNYLNQQEFNVTDKQQAVEVTTPLTTPLTFDFREKSQTVPMTAPVPAIPNYGRSQASTGDSVEFHAHAP